jgi:hypothetical protein
MLEDVRPGDVLEWSYTIESRPTLLPERYSSMFTLPAGVPVGKIHFLALFNPSRAMQWRSSFPDWEPEEEEGDDEMAWIWLRENHTASPPEENTPAWHVAYPWIQLSDCPDWGMVAAAFSEAWEENEDDEAVSAMAGEIAAKHAGAAEQAEAAIAMIHEEYRYVAADGVLDGRPPTPPGTAARRRYGDAKDLSFLLAHLLKRLGVEARLVLVNTVIRRSIADLLPAPGLFDHLLVECELRGATRWIDVTRKRELAPDYGAGLPLAGVASELTEAPESRVRSSLYELNESFLLDTAGDWSWYGVVVAARGAQAEALRQELETEGLEALAEKRLRECVRRFGNARRIGNLEYRDDRAANEFFLSEIFEIKEFMTLDAKNKWFKFELTNDYAINFLKRPDPGLRRTPFALPHPCNVIHRIELHSTSLAPAVLQQRHVDSEFVHFTRMRRTLAGNWTMTLHFATRTDAVLPEELDKHRQAMEKIRDQCVWSILLPVGDPRPHERSDFARMPVSWRPDFVVPPVPEAQPQPQKRPPSRTPLPVPAQPSKSPAQKNPGQVAVVPGTRSSRGSSRGSGQRKRHKRHRRRRDKKRIHAWQIVVTCVLALFLIVIMVVVAKNADRWHIFKIRPAAPVVTPSGQPED